MGLNILLTFVIFIFGGVVGGYAMLTSGLIVLTNIIEPAPEVKTYQFEAICNQEEKRECEIKYIRVYLPEGNKNEQKNN